jgi:hypothetical protein
MKSAMLLSAISIASASAFAQPGKSVLEACLRAESAARHANYAPIPGHHVFETVDTSAQRVDTAIRHGKEEIGIWTTSSPGRFGLLYNGRDIPAARIARLTGDAPSPFDPRLAMWGIVGAGARSYACITFNFEGLGQSGSFQTVRGIYLIERHVRRPRAYYATGRVTKAGVVPAK